MADSLPSCLPLPILSGVSGFISAGSVCDSLPAEGDLRPAAVPSVINGLCYGGGAWPGKYWEEDTEETWGPADAEDGQTPRPTHPEEHVSLPDWPLLWHAHHRFVSVTLRFRCWRKIRAKVWQNTLNLKGNVVSNKPRRILTVIQNNKMHHFDILSLFRLHVLCAAVVFVGSGVSVEPDNHWGSQINQLEQLIDKLDFEVCTQSVFGLPVSMLSWAHCLALASYLHKHESRYLSKCLSMP